VKNQQVRIQMSRYEDTRIRRNKDLNRVYSYTMYPRIPLKNSDIFITPTYGTRLDLLANEYYKDSTLWWIIAQANGIKGFKGQLRIPTEIQSILNEFSLMNR
jgi:hypothetical protein